MPKKVRSHIFAFLAIFFKCWRLLIGCSSESTNQKSPKFLKNLPKRQIYDATSFFKNTSPLVLDWVHTQNPGFGFWKCHREMVLNKALKIPASLCRAEQGFYCLVLRQVQQGFSSFFDNFTAYLMIFQSFAMPL